MYGWAYALQQCVALTFMCLIYYFRAGFEEIHLMHYPEYRKYAASPVWNSSNTSKAKSLEHREHFQAFGGPARPVIRPRQSDQRGAAPSSPTFCSHQRVTSGGHTSRKFHRTEGTLTAAQLR